MTLLGLMATGTYTPGSVTWRGDSSVVVGCGRCGDTFVLALLPRSPIVVLVQCPKCSIELVVCLFPKEVAELMMTSRG